MSDGREYAYADGLELRASPGESQSPGTLVGYAIKWNTISEPLRDKTSPGFRETFRPHAFARSLSESDAFAVVDHDETATKVFGRTTSGTLKLYEDEIGLRFENVLPDTAAGRDLARLVARGDIRGVSVAFHPAKGGIEWQDVRSGLPLRIVSEARIDHMSYEPRPAYRDTSVALRSLEEARAGSVDAPEPDDRVMIALYPPPDVAARLAIAGGEAPESLHLTLAYLGRALEVGTAGIERAAQACAVLASFGWPLSGQFNGVGRFSASDTSDGLDVLYASADVPALAELRQRLVLDLECAGVAPSKAHGFVPHLTLAYLDPAAESPVERLAPISVSFAALSLVVEGERRDFPLDPGAGFRSETQDPPPATPEPKPSHDLSLARARLRLAEAES